MPGRVRALTLLLTLRIAMGSAWSSGQPSTPSSPGGVEADVRAVKGSWECTPGSRRRPHSQPSSRVGLCVCGSFTAAGMKLSGTPKPRAGRRAHAGRTARFPPHPLAPRLALRLSAPRGERLPPGRPVQSFGSSARSPRELRVRRAVGTTREGRRPVRTAAGPPGVSVQCEWDAVL